MKTKISEVLVMAKYVCIVFVLGAPWLLTRPVLAGESVISIRLRPQHFTQQRKVILADVADIQGETSAEQTIGNLDLCTHEREPTTIITRDFVDLRLALAGNRIGQYKLVGAEKIVVHFAEEGTKLGWSIEERVADAVASRLNRPTSDVRVRNLSPQFSDASYRSVAGMKTPPVVILPEGPLPGRRTVWLSQTGSGSSFQTMAIPVEIAIRQHMIRVIRPIVRGTEVTAEQISLQAHFVTSIEADLSLNSVIGHFVRRNMQIGERLTAHDLMSHSPETPAEILVRPRDSIRLVARHQGIEYVVPMAEALQSGRLGQVIRVKNLQSNRVVNARVASAEEAFVDLH